MYTWPDGTKGSQPSDGQIFYTFDSKGNPDRIWQWDGTEYKAQQEVPSKIYYRIEDYDNKIWATTSSSQRIIKNLNDSYYTENRTFLNTPLEKYKGKLYAVTTSYYREYDRWHNGLNVTLQIEEDDYIGNLTLLNADLWKKGLRTGQSSLH